MTLQIAIERGADGYVIAHCPTLNGCWSQGRTREEALQNIREAIELFFEPDPRELAAGADHELVTLNL